MIDKTEKARLEDIKDGKRNKTFINPKTGEIGMGRVKIYTDLGMFNGQWLLIGDENKSLSIQKTSEQNSEHSSLIKFDIYDEYTTLSYCDLTEPKQETEILIKEFSEQKTLI